MQGSRRNLLIAGGIVAVGVVAGGGYAVLGQSPKSTPIPPSGTQPAPNAAPLPPDDPRMAERAIGKADAPVTVAEWFSLTCPHCAAFAQETLPRVTKELVDAGRLRYVFKDFPLDKVALTAAMVARSLPPERYVPFCAALLASQDRWAFARGREHHRGVGQDGGARGNAARRFDAAVNDAALRAAILQGAGRRREYLSRRTRLRPSSSTGQQRRTAANPAK